MARLGCEERLEESRSNSDYVLHVWQPLSVEDRHPDTVGIEAWPINLDGSGNGSLPGGLNGNQSPPALDHAGDRDVFQVHAASDRPIKITVSGLDTFLRVYDASGRAIATDHNSGSNGESQVTLEANRGDLSYIEVTAFSGTDTGAYRCFSFTVSGQYRLCNLLYVFRTCGGRDDDCDRRQRLR